jgi:hypothetical protein
MSGGANILMSVSSEGDTYDFDSCSTYHAFLYYDFGFADGNVDHDSCHGSDPVGGFYSD